MAQLVIAAAGAAIGGATLGTGIVALGMTGTAIGWSVGSMLGSMLGPKQKSQGPRLNDLTVTSSSYGTPIPYVLGSPRLAGQVVWASTKREIATTTEQGKGGGGSEFTSYTYEVDLLVLLADNSVPGISRVWESGELVYSRLTSAPSGTVNASAETARWRRLTFYDGNPAQMPDATYEADVGTDSALAYRGRSTVFIEGLQLGSSGTIQNETFELYSAGVETPADDLTRLQSSFAEGSTDDESVHAIGSATSTGTGTLSDGNYQIALNSTDRSSLTWDHVDLLLNSNMSLTVEWFARFDEITVNPSAGLNWATLVFGSESLTWNMFGYSGGVNAISVVRSGTGTLWNSTYDVLDSVWRHFAIVFRTSGVYDIYANGVRIVTGRSYAYFVGAPTGRVELGGTGTGGQTVQINYSGARVRRQEMYTGATFSPPASPAEWGAAYLALSTIEPSTLTIAQAVSAICLRAGMTAGQFDVTALSSITQPVRAMAIPLSSARTALETLAGAYFFEAVLSDKLYFRPRGGAAVATIPYTDLGVTNSGQFSDPLAIVDANEVELPAQIALTYHNVDGDYQTDTQYSDRLLSSLKSTSTVQMAIGMTASEAKKTADAMLVDGVVALKSTTLLVDGSYTRLEPTDVVQAIGSDGSTYRLRLLQRKDESGVLQFDAVLDDASVLTQAGITAGATASQTVVLATPNTTARLLDIRLLREEYDSPGYYIAVNGGSATNWRQAAVYESADNVSYAQETTIGSAAVIGATTTALANWSGGNLWDDTSSVTVSVTGGELSSVTQLQAEARRSVNAALIDEELVQFRTATLVSPGVYTLTGFLRGRRGTEWATSTHAIGDRFVLLAASGIRFVPLQLAELGGLRYVKAVTAGQLLSDAASQTITPLGVALKPSAPVLASADRSAADTVLSWHRRTRLSSRITGPLAWSSPLGEASESYRIDVYTTSGYTTIVRTLYATDSQVTYTAADQTTDFGSPPATLYLGIRQISATVGAGYELRAAV